MWYDYVGVYREYFSGEQEFTMCIEYKQDNVYYKSEPIKVLVTGTKTS